MSFRHRQRYIGVSTATISGDRRLTGEQRRFGRNSDRNRK
jgi:hypothetical protein